jgi:hypothetical protein
MEMRFFILFMAVASIAQADHFRGGDARDLYSLLKSRASVGGDGHHRRYYISSVSCVEREDRRIATCSFYDVHSFGGGPRLSITGREGKEMMSILARNFPFALSTKRNSLKLESVRCYLEGLGQNIAIGSRFYSCVSP